MKKEVKIGIAIIGGVVLFYVALTWAKSMHFFAANRNKYQIRFSDVSGLKEGDPVTVFGYPSGNVESIDLDGQGAIVSITLDNQVAVKSDAKAEIRVKELMGGKQVALDIGQAPGLFAESSMIPGTIALDFSSAFSKAGEFMDLFDAQEIDSLVRNISKVAAAFARVGDEIDSLDTDRITNDLTASAASLRNVLTNVEQRRLVDKLDESLGKMNALADRAGETMTSVDKLTAHVSDRTLPKADEMLTKVGGMLDDTEGMVKELRDLLHALQDTSTFAGRILHDPALSDQFDATLDNLNVTLEHIRTKKIFVTMTLSKNQRIFDEEPPEDKKRKEK